MQEAVRGRCVRLRLRGLSSQDAWRHLFVAIAFIAFAFAPHANATIVIPLSEEALIEDADAIVTGQVTWIQAGYDHRRAVIFTNISVAVEEVVKGTISVGEIALRQPGGSFGDLHSWIEGNPHFALGEKVLLFLRTTRDGSVRVAHLYQGKFTVFLDPASGEEYATRETPPGIRTLRNANRGPSQATVQKETHRLQELRGRIRGHLQKKLSAQPSQHLPSASPAALSADTTLGSIQAEFTFMGPARWFQPDSNNPVSMMINSAGEPLAPTNGFDQVRQAFHAWSGVSGSTFHYQDGGYTAAAGYSRDGVNAVSFRDPDGDMDPPVNCSGTLAVGGFFYTSSQTRTVNETTFYRITEGDLVFNDGWVGCGFYENLANFAEVATHELGHVLGLGHSSESNATMHPMAHFDRRGASLRQDDIAGLQAIYPGFPLTVVLNGSGSGTVTSTPSGINCDNDCTETFANDTSVTLTAAPATDSSFTGWSGAGCSGTGTCVVTMTAARSVTATFTAAATPLTVTSFTADKTGSQPAGTAITFTMTNAGGVTPYQYKWWVWNGSAWSLGRDWATGNTFTWTPTAAGTYFIHVWVRNAGATADAAEAFNGLWATITP